MNNLTENQRAILARMSRYDNDGRIVSKDQAILRGAL